MMKIARWFSAVLLLAFAAPLPGNAAVELVETCTDTIDAAIVTWDCELQDTTYTVGSVASFTVNWSSSQNAAFSDFALRKSGFTPKAKKLQVAGSDPSIDGVNDGPTGSVDVSIVLTDLHQAGKKGLKGNAHFFLYLWLDEDGDGEFEDKPVKFGVNLHVTDPQEAEAVAAGGRLQNEAPVTTTSWGGIKSLFSDQ